MFTVDNQAESERWLVMGLVAAAEVLKTSKYDVAYEDEETVVISSEDESEEETSL